MVQELAAALQKDRELIHHSHPEIDIVKYLLIFFKARYKISKDASAKGDIAQIW